MTKIIRCNNCFLSENFPGVRFNPDGICNYCEQAPSAEVMEENRQKLKYLLKETFEASKRNGDYDAIVAFSGGKDSSYTLKMLVEEYNLNCLAVTVDNGFLSDKALNNCRAVTESLKVDFMLFKPSSQFMMNMYRQSISSEGQKLVNKAAQKRASAICNSCINLINNVMIKVALQNKCHVIAGGYIGGQIPAGAGVINLDLVNREQMKEHLRDVYRKLYGNNADKFFYLNDEQLKSYDPEKPLYVVNPMLAEAVSEEQIIRSIKTLGWEKTLDTGKNSSNCKLNDLGIALHYQLHHFHPYEAEIAEQVRYGLMNRKNAKEKLESIPKLNDLKEQALKIGIEISYE